MNGYLVCYIAQLMSYFQKRLKCSLLIVMNEARQVLAFKIVPNDTREYLKELLQQIQTIEERQVQTKMVYTDNAIKDQNSIHSLFSELFPEETPPEVLQVS